MRQTFAISFNYNSSIYSTFGYIYTYIFIDIVSLDTIDLARDLVAGGQNEIGL